MASTLGCGGERRERGVGGEWRGPGGRGDDVEVVQTSRGAGGKQEVARGGAHASGMRPSSWQRRKTTGEVAVVGWASQL